MLQSRQDARMATCGRDAISGRRGHRSQRMRAAVRQGALHNAMHSGHGALADQQLMKGCQPCEGRCQQCRSAVARVLEPATAFDSPKASSPPC